MKRRRNNDLLAVQNEISEVDNLPLIGREMEVLVEGPSKSSRKLARLRGRWKRLNEASRCDPVQLTGRTHCDRIVVFDGNPRQIGQILPITIYDASAFTLFGEVVTRHVGPEVYSLA